MDGLCLCLINHIFLLATCKVIPFARLEGTPLIICLHLQDWGTPSNFHTWFLMQFGKVGGDRLNLRKLSYCPGRFISPLNHWAKAGHFWNQTSPPSKGSTMCLGYHFIFQITQQIDPTASPFEIFSWWFLNILFNQVIAWISWYDCFRKLFAQKLIIDPKIISTHI